MPDAGFDAVERYPGPVTLSMLEQARMGALVWSLKAGLVGDVRTILWVLLGTVAMVLLIASANVANLFLVRAEGRIRQVALHKALGADRWRVARAFLSWDDLHSRRRVAVVTENLARELGGEPSGALGKRVSTLILEGTPGVWREVVGVGGDVHDDGLSADPVATAFWPQIMEEFQGSELGAQRSMAFAVRGEPGVLATLLPWLQEAVWSISASLPLADVTAQSDRLDRSLARTSFLLVLLGIAAAVALLLGAVGICGVISYAVSQRSREIGVRMALGAERGTVAGTMLRQGLVLAAIGIVVVTGAALGLTRLMSSLLYGVDPLGLPTYGAVGATLAVVAAVASWLPARRAAAVDPALTLREEQVGRARRPQGRGEVGQEDGQRPGRMPPRDRAPGGASF